MKFKPRRHVNVWFTAVIQSRRQTSKTLYMMLKLVPC